MNNKPKKYSENLFYGSLYATINNDYSSQDIRHKSVNLAATIADSGCDIIQYRARNILYSKMLDEAKSIFQICKAKNIPFLINNHIDLALDVGADGVHLSGGELVAKHIRAILGNDKIIGLTITSEQQAQQLDLEALNYVTIASSFTMDNQPTDEDHNLTELKDIVKIIKSRAPHVAIVAVVGMEKKLISKLFLAGVDTISVVSTISQAKTPSIVCKILKTEIAKATRS